jgi:hypothetical protein
VVGAQEVKVIAADSAAALLDKKFNPVCHVACAAVLVEPPYREPSARLAEPIFRKVDDGCEIIVHEAELCLLMLGTSKADIVHLDMSLGGFSIEELSPVELISLRASRTGRQNILKILPRLRKVAGEIKRLHGIDMLAIGKQSLPVRVAELTAGAEAVLFACQRSVEDGEEQLLGLPHYCQPRLLGNRVDLCSLMAGEHDVRGFSVDTKNILPKVKLVETLNPVARGFRALKITPTKK